MVCNDEMSPAWLVDWDCDPPDRLRLRMLEPLAGWCHDDWDDSFGCSSRMGDCYGLAREQVRSTGG